jgi:hypothetical protein
LIIVVTGSRTWTDKERIRQRLLHYKPDLVVTGGHKYKDETKSADALAKQVCEEEGIPCETRKANWRQYGSFAGFLRNAEMLDEFNPDLVLAFWDGFSSGTKNCIQSAYHRGITVEVQLWET